MKEDIMTFILICNSQGFPKSEIGPDIKEEPALRKIWVKTPKLMGPYLNNQWVWEWEPEILPVVIFYPVLLACLVRQSFNNHRVIMTLLAG